MTPDPPTEPVDLTLPEPAEVGRRLRAARKAAGWPTVRAAARRIGMGEVQLTQLETGRRLPNFATLYRLVHGLGLDPRAVFAGPGQDKPTGPPAA